MPAASTTHHPDLSALSRCCGVPLRRFGSGTPSLALDRCPHCGTLWAARIDAGDVSPWEEADITPVFYAALRERRERQAREIVERLQPLFSSGPVLDYGAGQGALLRALLAAGVDAWGCDLATPEAYDEAAAARFVALVGPWAMPTVEGRSDWAAITLLDVVEHHPDPAEFIGSLPASRYLVIKVPLVTGPIARAARGLARTGSTALLETLFLVGDAAPHHAFFTPAGLRAVAAASGWRPARLIRLAEVGPELPDRIRADAAVLRRKVIRLGLAGFGTALAITSPLWSDTGVFVFERGA